MLLALYQRLRIVRPLRGHTRIIQPLADHRAQFIAVSNLPGRVMLQEPLRLLMKVVHVRPEDHRLAGLCHLEDIVPADLDQQLGGGARRLDDDELASHPALARRQVLRSHPVLHLLPVAPWLGPAGMWVCMAFATACAGLFATQSAFAGPQYLVPSVVILAIIGPVSMQRITRHLSAWPGSSRLGGDGVVLAGLSLQFFMFFSRLSTHF